MLVSSTSYLLLRNTSLYEKQQISRIASPAHLIRVPRGCWRRSACARGAGAAGDRIRRDAFADLVKTSTLGGIPLPVVDRDGRMTGIVSINDIRAVLFEETIDRLIVRARTWHPQLVRVHWNETFSRRWTRWRRSTWTSCRCARKRGGRDRGDALEAGHRGLLLRGEYVVTWIMRRKRMAVWAFAASPVPRVAFAAGQDPPSRSAVPRRDPRDAKLMGHLAVVLGQPAVLGSSWRGSPRNLHLAGVPGLDGIATDPGVDLFARIGVVSPVPSGAGVRRFATSPCGPLSFLVAVLGVAAPSPRVARRGLARPATFLQTHAFLGATCARRASASTARVLQDIGKSPARRPDHPRGAVVDDVLGLIILGRQFPLHRRAGRGLPPGSGRR